MPEARFMASVLLYTVAYIVESFLKPVHSTLTFSIKHTCRDDKLDSLLYN